ncbi:AraC family transcriptional regulator [Streptomyces hirsutus]|uniref:AraC family transcriptional regulator n=1 Tax=Streptomyces hirsutus TaxID=35620 RepID=A0ABZ1GP66_9ACTN|nr:helix-turn-helix domain-containing protein [Streptomyces hirsutus]WSD07979.1 AraC family transcriptional regulator [Streptomyces hirsutus]WTD18574.1 AraC family transcriptional regulator [Streptomyces hirsutus]WTD76521.1 AraC family transcriptional regulator [Streptomyces sp. NBC_01635]
MKLSSYQNLRVPNFSVHNLRQVLEEADLDWRTALANAEIDPNALTRPGSTIPARKELAFQLQFVALTRDRVDLWVRASRAYATSTYGARGMALATAPTVAAWTEVASATDNAPGLLEITPLRAPDGRVTGIEFTYPDAPEELIPFSVYRDLCTATPSLAWLYGGTFPFTRIEVPLAEISPEALTYVSCAIDCCAEALRLWWDPAISTEELPFGNAFQHEAWVKADAQIIDSFRATGDWPHTVAKAIRAAPNLNRTLANVAATLRVSPRTLQRKLELTGDDFARVRDETLSDLACDLLSHTDHSVAEISRKLGYTDPASFTMAFKRWRGMPPTAFREASRYEDKESWTSAH